MTTLNTEEPKTVQSTSTTGAKPSKKGPVSERRAHVAPAKAKSGKKAGSAKKALGGHLKTGHTWSLQNRPTERTQNKSSYNSTTIV